jgi:hypothetical protein
MQRSLVHQKTGVERIGEGLWLDRLQPGGRFGPGREVLNPLQGGQVWTDMFHLGSEGAPFVMTVPDIRLPANQIWPLHWHDCWIAVVILEGSCMIGDWEMHEGDLLISAAELEYGPLVIGPDGCQMFEVFAQLHLSPGGYSPEYRDHPTLRGGQHAFRERSPLNRRNDGRSSLPIDGVEGLIKGRLEPGARWDLGSPDDPERGVMGYTGLAAGETIPVHGYGDWHGLFVMQGGAMLGGRSLAKGDVILAAPNVRLDAITAGPDGAELFEVARTARGMERLA